MAILNDTPVPVPDLEKTLTRFSNFCFARLGMLPNTVDLNVGYVRRFAPSIGLNPTHDDVEGYVADMRRSGKSSAHITTACVAIEHYLQMIGNPIHLGRPRRDRKLTVNVLTEAEVAILIAAAHSLRERAILCVLAYSGARNREICNLRLRDVDIAHQTVTIHKGKNSKSRKVCLSGDCVEVLLQYLTQRGGGPDDYLFVTVRHGHQMATQDLRKLMRVIGRRVGSAKRIYPHLLRHTLATAMLHRGAGLLSIKDQLGHAYIETTMIYLHASSERLAAEYRQFCPSYV